MNDSFCQSCLSLLVKSKLDDKDRAVLFAIYDALLELSEREGLGDGRLSSNFKGLTSGELGRRANLTRHFTSRSVFRLTAFNLVVTYPEGRSVLHQLSPEGYRACRILFEN